MRIEFTELGQLEIIAENKTEAYALNAWIEKNVDTCNMIIKPKMIWFDTYIKMKKCREKLFWLSIKKVEDCLFMRRNGFIGKIIYDYSICLRLFGINIL